MTNYKGFAVQHSPLKTLPYCGHLVRRHDPDRFLLSLFTSTETREALWSLFAFNHEIAKTREVVTETTIGLIRLQWWRDAIADIYQRKDIPDHEILKPLAETIKTYGLKQEHFNTLIYAREFDLETVLPGNLEGLINYTDFTTTPLLKMAVTISGGDAEMECVQPVATNYALAGLLRAIPFHAGQGRCYLPEDLMRERGVTLHNLYKPEKREALKAIVKKVASSQLKGMRPESRLLRATDILADIYFRQMERLNYDVFNPRLQQDPAFKVLRLWWRGG
jgi:phytoene synthase